MRGPVDQHDDGQPDGHLCGGHYHDEKNKDLSGRIVGISSESRQQQVDRIDHQFNRHEDHQGIAFDQHANHPDAKKDRAENQVVVVLATPVNGKHLLL